MGSKVVVFGTGSFAQVVHFYLTHDSDHEVVAFTVHEKYLNRDEVFGLPLVAFENLQRDFSPDSIKMYVAVGYKNVNQLRAGIYEEAKSKGYDLITYVSSRCTHWGDTVIGDNCFIFEDNTIQPFVRIGNDVVIWSGNHIGHHVTIGDHCFISSHVVISGHAVVGPYCFLGVNSTIRDNVQIGKSCIIGAGSIIMKSTKDDEAYVQERTRPHKRKSHELGL